MTITYLSVYSQLNIYDVGDVISYYPVFTTKVFLRTQIYSKIYMTIIICIKRCKNYFDPQNVDRNYDNRGPYDVFFVHLKFFFLYILSNKSSHNQLYK